MKQRPKGVCPGVAVVAYFRPGIPKAQRETLSKTLDFKKLIPKILIFLLKVWAWGEMSKRWDERSP